MTKEDIIITIEAAGVICSALLSILIIRNEIKLAKKDQELQYQSMKITLYDKRIFIYETLNKIYNILGYAQISLGVQSNTVISNFQQYYGKEIQSLGYTLFNNKAIIELLFNKTISDLIMNIHAAIVNIDFGYKLLELQKTDFTTLEGINTLREHYNDTLNKAVDEFKNTNILEILKPYLQISNLKK